MASEVALLTTVDVSVYRFAAALGEEGGHLFTWGGAFTFVEHVKDKKGKITEKKDSNKGCLGHGNTEGVLLPTRCTDD